MKLRNKKTGEIKDVESLGHEKSLRDEFGPQITLSWDSEYENLGECRTYNSLAEINEEWEDYEEPKEYWFIDCDGDVHRTDYYDSEWHNKRKQIGNYFDTREEAEKAVEKLKAWKWLKDNGFKFEGIEKRGYHINFYQGRSYESDKQCQQAMKDIDLLFGGE